MRGPSQGMHLRLRLLFTCAIAVTIVLGGIVCATNVIGTFTTNQNADAVLDALVDTDDIDSAPALRPSIIQYGEESQETINEAIYFSVTYDSDDTVSTVDLARTTSVDEDEARRMADEVVSSNEKDRGTIGDYRYRVVRSDDGTLAVFLDRGRQYQMLGSLVGTIGWVSAVAAVLTLLIVWMLSKRIVKPVVESRAKQRQFITDAGHDIKTPLTIISADADVLKMDLEALGMTDDLEWVDDIKGQVSNLTDLTNRLIYISKLDEGRDVRENGVDFCLSDVVSEQLQTFRSRAKVGDRTLAGNVQPDVRMHGDQRAITQMVAALLDNALKYSDPGGTIQVTLTERGRTVHLVVFNTADSIDKRTVSRWFDRFYQEDKSRTHREGGFGIGLSMVSAVVDVHGGKVQAVSKDGRSVSIEVTMPTGIGRREAR